MKDMGFFLLLNAAIILQRLVELAVARSNERWMKQQGAVEFGAKHYRWMVFVHSLFFLVIIFEKIVFNKGLSIFWPWILGIFLVTQGLRLWAVFSLGRYWNTKILVLPKAKVVKKGPYRFIKHPNYLVVAVELFTVPILFNEYFSAILFTILNVFLLAIRIPEEEKALKQCTNYEENFKGFNRFLPKMLNKCDS